jgi:gamma-glutamyltranspeptidase/glutathione hydrolase
MHFCLIISLPLLACTHTEEHHMTANRREFLKRAGVGIASAGISGLSAWDAEAQNRPAAEPLSCDGLSRQGPKEVVRGKRAIASSQHPIVTQTMLDVMKSGGNAVDAAMAGAITQASVQLDMTNHTGTVTFLYFEAKTGRMYQLDGAGTAVPHLPIFRPMPVGFGGAGASSACIPGFMPAAGAIHARFGTKPWKTLVEYAIPWAENGHRMDEFTRSVLEDEMDFHAFFPASRALYMPNGFLPSVGELWKNPDLARTLRRLADEGPEYFTKGEWAQHFVQTANQLGWRIKLEDLSANPPRWLEPLRYEYKGYEIVQLAPPQKQGLFCNLVMGMLKHLDIASLGHYTESAESFYYMAHAMRRANLELAQLNDPLFFDVPLDIWMSDEYHARLADILRRTRPKRGVDLTQHVELTTGKSQLQAFGYATEGPNPHPPEPAGTCELTCVDADGNWVQMTDTLQGGGIPGMVVDGVPMYGNGYFAWLGLPGSRIVRPLGNTIMLKDGKPVHSMGSPGNVAFTVPQVLSNVLDYKMDPYEAAVQPRMSPMRDDWTVDIETRISERVFRDLVKLGVKLKPLPPFDFHMGSFQQGWRDPKSGLLSASTDPRRAGQAGGF